MLVDIMGFISAKMLNWRDGNKTGNIICAIRTHGIAHRNPHS